MALNSENQVEKYVQKFSKEVNDGFVVCIGSRSYAYKDINEAIKLICKDLKISPVK